MNLQRALWTNIWPAALLALVTTAVLDSRSADATVYTWKNTGSNWNTGTNWVGNSVPVSGSTNSLFFNGAGGTTNNNIVGAPGQGSLNFGASAGAYTLTGNVLRLGSLSNSSANTQTLSTLGINQFNAGTYDTGASVVIGGQFQGSANITKTGAGTLVFANSGKTYTGTVTANEGTVEFSNSGFTNGNLTLANGANFVSTGVNNTVGNLVATGSGTIALGVAGVGTLNTSNFNLSNFTGEITVGSSGQGSFDQVVSNDTNTFGGNLAISLDYTPENFDSLLNGEAWQFFSATTSSGNFSTVNLTVGGTTYNMTNSNGFWTTSGQLDGFGPTEGFLFSTVDTTLDIGGQQVSVVAGTLYAVPEPSTIVFAGIGMAMVGWSTLTRRRAKARRQAIEASIA